jgi:hypothetical protein
VKRREFITLLGGAAAGWPLAARAQQPDKIPRVGFLGNSTAALEANLVGPFREGLRDLGYQDGRNIVLSSSIAGRKESTIGFPHSSPNCSQPKSTSS